MAKAPSASSNIYTVLAFVALVALIGGIVFVVIRARQLGIEPLKYPTTSQATVCPVDAAHLA